MNVDRNMEYLIYFLQKNKKIVCRSVKKKENEKGCTLLFPYSILLDVIDESTLFEIIN